VKPLCGGAAPKPQIKLIFDWEGSPNSSIQKEVKAAKSSVFKAGTNRVTFSSEGEKMGGILYLPKSLDSQIPQTLVAIGSN
jgi:hypothetical protein